MARPTGRNGTSDKSPRPPRPPKDLPHDLPLFPENAPRDEKGEPIVRP